MKGEELLLNDKKKRRMWKEKSWPILQYYPIIFLDTLDRIPTPLG
jgi:hypothetical protein